LSIKKRYNISEEVVFMEFTHENIRKWLEEYFQAFNRNNGDPKTVPNMEKYFTPDLEFISYILDVKRPDTRQGLLNTMVHPGLLEELKPEDFIIDEKRQAVAVILRVQFTEVPTKTVFPAKHNCAHYEFVQDKNGEPKIKRITYFTEPRSPSEPDMKSLMKKYREHAQL
jgi:hypothetical protein